MRGIVLGGVLLIAAAQMTAQSVAAQTVVKQPVSVSYQNLVQCFPELTSDSLSFKVDLTRLKELIDEKFITSNSQLRQRKIQFVDVNGQTMNLILRMKQISTKKTKTELSLQKVDAKGVVTDIRLTENQRVNPKQEVINGFLVGATVKSDHSSYYDTKLNGVSLVYTKNFKEVEELDLIDKPKKRSVQCEHQKDLGIICTCSKK
ncbi:hypothetical protein [Bdellovibrio sp. HCB2-146]|uniref:hypothetical protein n=1 Tax=Bdellovibrio sp. HCB2-146 TaxID=3394362 RepID=UPI0039BCD925